MSGGNGNTSLSLFRSLVDGTILEEVGKALLSLSLGDGGRKRGLSDKALLTMFDSACDKAFPITYLSVIDVTNCTNIDVGL